MAEQQIHNKVSYLGLLAETVTTPGENLETNRLEFVADRGYFRIEDIKACEVASVTSCVRVSAANELRLQLDVLAATGCEPAFTDHASGRTQDIGGEERRGGAHGLLQAQLLIDGGKFIKGLVAPKFRVAAVVEQVAGADTAMRAHLAMGDSAILEQLHQVRPRYLQEVGLLARCQFRIQGRQCDAITARHVV